MFERFSSGPEPQQRVWTGPRVCEWAFQNGNQRFWRQQQQNLWQRCSGVDGTVLLPLCAAFRAAPQYRPAAGDLGGFALY